MPRRAAAQIRPIEPDPVHRNRLVQQVINKVMLDGKKSVAEKIVYDALAILGERSGKNPVEQLEAGIKALTPVLEVQLPAGGRRHLPGSGRGSRSARPHAGGPLAGRICPARREKTMAQRLANELLDAQQQQGTRTSARTISTAWPRPTRPSPTTAGRDPRGLLKAVAVAWPVRQLIPRVDAAAAHPES